MNTNYCDWDTERLECILLDGVGNTKKAMAVYTKRTDKSPLAEKIIMDRHLASVVKGYGKRN